MTFLAVIHIVASILLIGLVLIQDSKGAMGGTFGGGGGSSSSILGPTGAPNFLFKATIYVVIIFALTSFFLTKLSSEKGSSALDEVPLAAATKTVPTPTTAEAPAAPAAQTPTAPAQQNH